MEQYVHRSKHPMVIALLILSLFSVGCESAATRYEKHVAIGRERLTDGHLQEAILSLKSALAARPGDIEARKLLTECYLDRGAREPAEELIEALSKEVIDDPDVPLLNVRLALLSNNPDRALDVLQGYMAVHGENPAALVLVGHAHAAKKLWSEALQAYDLALSKDPEHAESWLGKALVLATLKRNDEAIAAAAHAATSDPHMGRAHLIVAELWQAAGDLDAARLAYNRALENDPRVMLPARFGLGQILLAQKDAKGALKQAERLVKDFASRPEGYFLQGVAHYLLDDSDAATADLQTCLAKAPSHPGAQLYLALAQYRRQQWQQALGAAKPLQAQFPGVKPIEMLIAELLLRTGDHQGAAKQAQHMLDVVPDSSWMYRVLGLARIQGGDIEGGAEALEEAQRLAPSEKLEFALGDLYLSMDEIVKASSNFEAIAAANPESRAANVRLFYTRMRQKNYDGALGLLDTLEEKEPEDPMWLNLRGAALYAKNDVAGAEAIWKKAVATSPELAAAHLNLAGVYKTQEKWAEARREYQEVLASRPQHSIAHRELALLDLRDGDPEKAIDHLKASLAAQPSAQAALQLAELQLRVGHISAAQEAARTATQIQPDFAAGWLQLGVTSLTQGDLAGGEASLRKASELAPDSALVWYHLGGVEAQKKNWTAARAHLKKAAAIAPDDPSVATRLANVELAAGDKKAAADIADRFFRRHPDMPAAYQIKADVEEVSGRIEDARRTWGQARQRFGEKVGVLLLQAEFERRQGNSAAATELYSRVIEVEPRAVPVLLRRAVVAMQEGQFEEALQGYQAVLGLAPNHPSALNNLAYLYTDVLERPADSLALLQRVDPQVLSGSPSIRDTLGWAQLKTGDTAAAVSTLRKVAQELPEVASVRYHLGAALIAAGKNLEGEVELQAAIDLGLSPAEKQAAENLLPSSP